MKPPTNTTSRATVVVLALLVVAAGATVGLAMADTGPTDGSPATAAPDQAQQVGPPQTQDLPGAGEGPTLTREGDRIHYSAPAGEAFHVTNLTVSDSTAADQIQVTADVTNTNDWPAIQHVVLRIDGDVAERVPIALNANATEAVSFTADTSNWTDGNHHVSVLSYDYGEVTTVSTEQPVPESPTATVSIDDQTTDGTMVTVAAVNLSDGGFVVVHEQESLAAGDALGSTIGVSEYLPAGTHENVTVTLFDVPGAEFDTTALTNETTVVAMAHQDTNANQTFDFVTSEGVDDGPYTVDGNPVVDGANVTVEEEPVTTTTEQPTNETTDDETTDEPPTNETADEPPTNDDQNETDS